MLFLKSYHQNQNNGLLIVDLNLRRNYRLINVYRIFSPTDGRTQREYFLDQLTAIKRTVEVDELRCPIIMGYFNLDERMKYHDDYTNKWYFEKLRHFWPNGLFNMTCKFNFLIVTCYIEINRSNLIWNPSLKCQKNVNCLVNCLSIYNVEK